MNTDKTPGATRLDYRFNWQDWLGPDTIVLSTWTPDNDDLTVDESSFTNHVATVWLTGGVLGMRYKVVNYIETAMGRKEKHTLYVEIEEK